MADWKLSSRTAACCSCERTFADGERHVSSLSIQGEELARRDACEPCFRPEPGREDLFFWFTRTRSDRRRSLAFDLPTLEQLFLRLEGREERRIRELRYVLCLVLMRKRRLKLQRVERGEQGEAMIVRRPRRDEGWRVFVFDFGSERLESLRQELLNVFEGADPSLRLESEPLADAPAALDATVTP